MAVHVGEIHTELSARPSAPAHAAGGASESAEPRYPGVRDDRWRTSEARVTQLRQRVAARDSDD